jgi:hypothetical protein
MQQFGRPSAQRSHRELTTIIKKSAIKQVILGIGYFASERASDGPTLYNRDGNLILPKFADWEDVVWGLPNEKKLGRVPTVLWVASQFQCDRIIWLIGDARLASGQTEADWMRHYVRTRYRDLKRDFSEHFEHEIFRSEDRFIKWLNQISEFTTEGFNTATNLESAVPLLKKIIGNDIGIVQLVTSANHVQRALRDAVIAFGEGSILESRVIVGAIAAQTSYGRSTPRETVVYDNGVEK